MQRLARRLFKRAREPIAAIECLFGGASMTGHRLIRSPERLGLSLAGRRRSPGVA